MAEQKKQTGRGVPVGGVFILFLGIVFLLQTLNVLPWGLWGTLWRFWPAILVIIGLGIVLRRFNPWLMGLIVLAILFACLGLAIWQYGPSLPVEGRIARSYSQPLDNLENAIIRMDLSLGDLALAALPSGSPNLVEAGFSQDERGATVRADFSREDGTGILNLRLDRTDWHIWGDNEFSWRAEFSRDIPLMMDIKAAVSNLDADLSELEVTELKMKLDVGSYKVVLPSWVNDGEVKIDTALSSTEITIPRGVAARIRVNDDLCSVQIDRSRFPHNGDYYISSDYDTARNHIDIEVDCDLGRVEIK
jgi:hypothetical protein